VDGLSFAVAPGTIFGLLGPNGAAKSTTLKILTTLSRPTSGSASVLGFDRVKRPLEVRRRVASVIQETAVDLLLSVRDRHDCAAHQLVASLDLDTFIARAKGLVMRGFKPKDAAEIAAREFMFENDHDPDIARKVQIEAQDFLRRMKKR
jgi:ABC-type Na+ transport system ATPase subunit NatA